MMKTNVYESVPIFENEDFLLRQVNKQQDAKDLLSVYSDRKAVPLFNSDNCHGDLFYYDTMEKMEKALDFWEFSYREKYFVRWAVVDKKCGCAIGTIELFHRDAADFFTDCGLLRLDLRSDYENEQTIEAILNLILPDTCEMFYCDKIATKATALARDRRTALIKLGFCATNEKLAGQDGTRYGDYYVRHEG